MSDFADRTAGVYHFLFDKVPATAGVLPLIKKPANPWQKDGRAIVAKVKASGNLKNDIETVVSQLGQLYRVIKPGDKVLVKPNYNSADPPPASTDPAFLRVVLEMMLQAGAQVSVGDCSGGVWRPTRNVLRQVGLYDLGKELNVPVYAFEDERNEWVKVEINGNYLKWVTVPRVAYEADKIAFVPCLKTHGLAGFSGALKLAFGLVHPGERRGFHTGHLQEKLAEVNLWRLPDLVIMDGRKAFVTGGPNRGQVAEPGIIMASGDSVALDIEAIKTLVEYGARLPADPCQITQLAAADRHGLGDSHPVK
jgi:uncharacterized protein (DUF362 family)